MKVAPAPLLSAAILIGLVIALVVASGAGAPVSANDEAKAAIFDTIRPFEGEGVATIEFDKVVPGEWTEALLVCRGVDQDTLDQALGYSWTEGPKLASAGFAAMFVFSTGEAVESYVNLGQGKFVDNDLYVVPCEPNPEAPVETVPVIPRGSSQMTFGFDPSTYAEPTWIIVSTTQLTRANRDET